MKNKFVIKITKTRLNFTKTRLGTTIEIIFHTEAQINKEIIHTHHLNSKMKIMKVDLILMMNLRLVEPPASEVKKISMNKVMIAKT